MAETRTLGASKQRRNYWETSCTHCGHQNLVSHGAKKFTCKFCGSRVDKRK